MKKNSKDIKRAQKIARKTKYVFLAAAIFCLIFAIVYECFSHGVISWYMLLAWTVPALAGFMPMLVFQHRKMAKYFPGCLARYCWYTWTGLFTLGMILRGVLDIYGTTNKLLNLYWKLGICAAVINIALWVFILIMNKGGANNPVNPNYHKKARWPFQIIAMTAIVALTAYLVCDTFVITRVYTVVENVSTPQTSTDSDSSSEGGETTVDTVETEADGKINNESQSQDGQAGENQTTDTTSDTTAAYHTPQVTENSYSDGLIEIKLTEYEEYDTTIYVADIQLTSPEFLQSAFAQGAYGKNVTEVTSSIAAEADAILAINGDFYGSQESGYVIRNGILYRDTGNDGQEGLAIMSDGSFLIYDEGDISAQELLSQGAVQTLSFGPALVVDGEISVDEGDEVGKAKESNPRTAIGIIDDLHYVMVVSDGRTDESAGLSLLELAQFMQELGVKTAYNLDGGGSSTMYFNGEVINNPTTSGHSISEREVSDILYIGKV